VAVGRFIQQRLVRFEVVEKDVFDDIENYSEIFS